MTDLSTTRLSLPLIASGQAQKEMTHNEALARLDIAVQSAVLSAGIDLPPAEPSPGDAWIVGNSPEGVWTGQAGSVAGWTEAGWRFVAPREGTRAWVADAGGWALFSDGEWTVGESHGRVIVDGLQVVGPRAGAIADPAGGATTDLEARATLLEILAILRGHGLIDPE